MLKTLDLIDLNGEDKLLDRTLDNRLQTNVCLI